MGHESGYLADRFMALHTKNICLAQYENSDYGWWTDHSTKMKYAMSTREYLAIGNVSFMKNMICANPFIEEKDRFKIVRSKFDEQIKRVRLVATAPTQPHSTPKVTISGKVDKENKISATFQDDLMMAFMMNMHLWNMIIMRRVPNFNYQAVFGSPAVAA